MNSYMRELTVRFGAKAVRNLEKILTWGSTVGNPTFFSSDLFPWVRNLEAAAPKMRSELSAVLQDLDRIPNFQDISADQKHLSDDDDWKTYFFYAFGIRSERNCEQCPETARLIESVPGMQTAFFSILAPGKHIPDHRGVFKGVIRYHLGLIVPEPKEACRIRVGNDIRYWEEGKSLIFDDTYRHEVWNDTAGTRVILFMDVERPLRFPANVLNGLLIWIIRRSPLVKDGVANYHAWEAKLERRASAQTHELEGAD